MSADAVDTAPHTAFDTAVDVDRLDGVRARIDAFVGGDEALTGLDLYLELERVTPLLGFHTMLRSGPRNRMASGLQQTYGDHNRLLALGLDRLVAGDVDWLASRSDPADPPGRESLESACAAVADLELDAATAVALWVAAGLHDIGMTVDASSGLDVEYAAALAQPVLDALGIVDRQALVHFVIRHHDYVKDVYGGEAPAAMIAADLGELDAADRHVALTALGMVQIAGSASLGEGRLSAHRVGIMHRCVDGAVLNDVDHAGRVARLVEGPALDLPGDAHRRGAQWLTGAGFGVDAAWDGMVLHGWTHVRAAGAAADDTELDPAGVFAGTAWSPRVASALRAVARIWHATGGAADAQPGRDHVLITPHAASALVATGAESAVTVSDVGIGAGRSALRLDVA